MFDQTMLLLTHVCEISGAVVGLVTITGSALADMREERRRRDRCRHPYARGYRKRPLITVLVVTRNSGQYIESQLRSILSGSYKKVEVIVIDNASSDSTRRAVRQYRACYPKARLRLVARRSEITGSREAVQLFQRYGHGQLVAVLDGLTVPDAAALTRVAGHFNDDNQLAVLDAVVTAMPVTSLAGLAWNYQALLARQSCRLNTVAWDSKIQSVLIYTSSAFMGLYAKSDRTGDHFKSLMAETVGFYKHQITWKVIFRQSGILPSTVPLLTLLRRCQSTELSFRQRLLAIAGLVNIVCKIILTAILPIVVNYFIFLAFKLREPSMLLISLLILSILLATAIWESKSLNYQQKLLYTLGVPIMYWMFYSLSSVRVVFVAARLITNVIKRAAVYRPGIMRFVNPRRQEAV